MIKIDGSHGEGGGQIVRTALAMSMLTGKAFRVKNIRQGREKPGLKAQHVHCIKALKQLSDSKADGAEIGSEELLFIPGKLKAKNIEVDVGTAGSLTLLLQAILLPSMFSSRTHTLTLRGGTDTKWSMPYDYFVHVMLPIYKKFAEIDAKLVRRGYYPKGQGELQLTIRPKIKRNKYDTFEMFSEEVSKHTLRSVDQNQLSMIKGTAHASWELSKAQVAERMAMSAKNELKHLGVTMNISHEYNKTHSTGCGITLWAIFTNRHGDVVPARIGASELGERGKPAEEVGTKAAKKLLEELNLAAPIDSHLADNIIPIMALAIPSKIRATKITNHTKTNMWVCEQFLGKTFDVSDTLISSTWKA